MVDRHDMIIRGQQQQPQMPMTPYVMMPPQMYMPQGMGMGMPQPTQADNEPSLVRSVTRHFWIVVMMFIASVGGAFVWLSQTTPQYESLTKLYVDTSTPTGQAALNAGSFLANQCELIKSTTVLRGVAEDPNIKGFRTFGGGNALVFLRENLVAELGKGNDLINISIRSPYSDEAAIIVNKVADEYINYVNNNTDTKNTAVVKRLQEEEKKNIVDIATIESQLQDMRIQNPSLNFQSDGNNPQVLKLGELARQATAANLEVVRLKAQGYGENQPNVIKSKNVYAEFDGMYRDALKEYLDTTKGNNDFAKQNLELNRLRSTQDQLSERIKDIQIRIDTEGNIKGITQAEIARAEARPAFPKRGQTLALAGMIGLLGGCGLALLRDKMDTRLHSVEDIQTVTGLQILGVVPRMPGRRTAVARAMAVHLDPRSEVAEAYRTIRTAVYFSTKTSQVKTLLVTSPESGDGKTTSASNLAIAIAQTGRSILLLDADFRKPTQHKNLDVKDSVGLSSVLAGVAALDRAIQRTGVEGLDILPCGPIPENPSEILNSQEFGDLIDKLATKYDHILFDSPPVNLVTDARILGAVCDATILVLRAEKSHRKGAEHARNALMSVGANILGAIVNGVPRGKGYEVYGGTYYGTPEMRRPTAISPLRPPAAEPMGPMGPNDPHDEV